MVTVTFTESAGVIPLLVGVMYAEIRRMPRTVGLKVHVATAVGAAPTVGTERHPGMRFPSIKNLTRPE
jgi:hypothetical protein